MPRTKSVDQSSPNGSWQLLWPTSPGPTGTGTGEKSTLEQKQVSIIWKPALPLVCICTSMSNVCEYKYIYILYVYVYLYIHILYTSLVSCVESKLSNFAYFEDPLHLDKLVEIAQLPLLTLRVPGVRWLTRTNNYLAATEICNKCFLGG